MSPRAPVNCVMCGGAKLGGLLCEVCRVELRNRALAQFPRVASDGLVVVAMSRDMISAMTLALGIASESLKGMGDPFFPNRFAEIANVLHEGDANWTNLPVLADPANPLVLEPVEGVGKPS